MAGWSMWNLLAALAGWAFPGAGHLMLGQAGRGVVLGVTVGTLWLSGLLIGGVSVVDRGDHPAWFLGQMLIAPSFVADAYRGKLVREHEGTFAPQDDPPFEPAYGRAHEQGTLFTSLAGLLNLLAIIDLVYRPTPGVGAGAGRNETKPDPSPWPGPAAAGGGG